MPWRDGRDKAPVRDPASSHWKNRADPPVILRLVRPLTRLQDQGFAFHLIGVKRVKLHNFNPADGSFDYIANDDGSPAMTFYQLGNYRTYFQVVTGGQGSVNFDAMTDDGADDVDVGLWPQKNGGVYVQSETRPNWVKIKPSDAGESIYVQTGGSPYTHHVGLDLDCQGGPYVKVTKPQEPV
jgi:hypothetical protein